MLDARPGQTIILRHGEILNKDGHLQPHRLPAVGCLPVLPQVAGHLAGEQSAELGVPDLIPNIQQPHGGTAVWVDSAAIVPWNVYRATGDKDILERQYGSMKGWVEFLRSQETGRHLRLNGFQRGDWLALDRDEGRGNRGSTDPCLIASAFYAHSTWIVARSARELGLTADAEEYETLFEQIRADFQREFITETGRVVGETQTACALILAFDLARPQHVPRIVQTLADNLSRHGGKLTTGFVGTAYLCHALTRAGRHDLAGRCCSTGSTPAGSTR